MDSVSMQSSHEGTIFNPLPCKDSQDVVWFLIPTISPMEKVSLYESMAKGWAKCFKNQEKNPSASWARERKNRVNFGDFLVIIHLANIIFNVMNYKLYIHFSFMSE